MPKRSQIDRASPAPSVTPQSDVMKSPKGVRVGQKRSASVELAIELYAVLRLALKQLGVDDHLQQQAIRQSRQLPAAPRISGPLLRDSHGLADLLVEWTRGDAYLDAKGKPLVLPVKGPGVTFETLARRHLPDVALDTVVGMACATADVTKRSGDRIALLGGILVKMPPRDEVFLAHAIRNIDELLQTILHNRRRKRIGAGERLLQRRVTGVISRKQYPNFMREYRTQIYEMLERMDGSIQRFQPTTRRGLKTATAISVAVFVSQEDDWLRAGIDTNALVKRLKKIA